jgi:hypothetical protein
MSIPKNSGTIYAIIDNEYFYIDSTTKPLSERIEELITASKGKSKNSKFNKYINDVRGGWEDIIYIVLETVYYDNDIELISKKDEYINKFIKDIFCLNVLQSNKQKYAINYSIKKKKFHK